MLLSSDLIGLFLASFLHNSFSSLGCRMSRQYDAGARTTSGSVSLDTILLFTVTFHSIE
jgi:hypothetical protein